MAEAQGRCARRIVVKDGDSLTAAITKLTPDGADRARIVSLTAAVLLPHELTEEEESAITELIHGTVRSYLALARIEVI